MWIRRSCQLDHSDKNKLLQDSQNAFFCYIVCADEWIVLIEVFMFMFLEVCIKMLFFV
jgi:hypothetical protein